MLVWYYVVAKQQVDVDALFEPPGSPRVTDVEWAAIIAFVLGIVATWMFLYGIPSYLQGPAAKGLGGIDLSWLAGAVVAGAVSYVGLSRRTTPAPAVSTEGA
jgi:toxin CptA